MAILFRRESRTASTPTSPTDATIAVRGVSKTFDNGFPAIGAAELTVSAGEFVSIVGVSGCGKS